MANDIEIPVKDGLYHHFKGNYYLVKEVRTDDVTQELVVDYLALYAPFAFCTRTVVNFAEHVDKPDHKYHGPRFRYIRTLYESPPTFLT